MVNAGEETDADVNEDNDGEGDEISSDGADHKPKRRKRRKKYEWSESEWRARGDEEKKFAQEVKQVCYFPTAVCSTWLGKMLQLQAKVTIHGLFISELVGLFLKLNTSSPVLASIILYQTLWYCR